MFFNVYPFIFFPVVAGVFTHSDVRMVLSFAIIGSIAATALNFMNNARTQRKKTRILSLNAKKLINLHLAWKIIRKLQSGSLFFITRLILVRIWSENLPKYGSTIIKPFLVTVVTTIFGVGTLPKNSCQRSHVGKYFPAKYFLIYLFHDGTS